METLNYKLDLSFDNLNQVIEFYKTKINKSEQHAVSTIVSMSLKGYLTNNPDKSITMTWFFRNKQKYNKFVDAYIKFKSIPVTIIPQARKTYNEMIFNE